MQSSNKLQKILIRMFLFYSVFCLSNHIYAMAAYTDVWYDENSSTFYGCGVSTSEYNSTIHNLKVTTTFSTPNGRTASVLTTGFTYARADVSIPFLHDKSLITLTQAMRLRDSRFVTKRHKRSSPRRKTLLGG